MTLTEFELLASQLRPTVVCVGKRFFNSNDDAEDVAQETLIRLWKYAERMDRDHLKEALAIKVAKNVCIDIYRKRHALGQAGIASVATTALGSDAMEQSPHEQLVAKEMERTMAHIVNNLPPRERSLFEMKQTEGLSNDEISMCTGIPKASVKAMVSAARRKVFEKLRKQMTND